MNPHAHPRIAFGFLFFWPSFHRCAPAVVWPPRRHSHDVIMVDNLSRRRIDLELGCESLTPIQSPQTRVKVIAPLRPVVVLGTHGLLCLLSSSSGDGGGGQALVLRPAPALVFAGNSLLSFSTPSCLREWSFGAFHDPHPSLYLYILQTTSENEPGLGSARRLSPARTQFNVCARDVLSLCPLLACVRVHGRRECIGG